MCSPTIGASWRLPSPAAMTICGGVGFAYDTDGHRQVVVPLLWHAECANLLLRAERRSCVSAEQCSELLDLLGALPIETDDETAQIRRSVIRLATVHRLTAYGAIYLDLAARRGIALANRDKKICDGQQPRRMCR
jgi:predicted nucleic acid-binding protein